MNTQIYQICGTARIGRAGRDGEPARCVLFYRFSDVLRQAALMCLEVRLPTAPIPLIKLCLSCFRPEREHWQC